MKGVVKDNSKGFYKTILLLLVAFSICIVQGCSKADDEDDGANRDSYVKLGNGNYSVNGHEAVDLGLSVLWATCNIGSSSPKEVGNYYAWGETYTKKSYSWDNYEWLSSSLKITKYKNRGDLLKPEDDAATVKWGKGWRMPTKEELDELFESCTFSSVREKLLIDGKERSRVVGYEVTGPSGKKIYVPVSGYYEDAELKNDKYSLGDVRLWSSTSDGQRAYSYDEFWDCARAHYRFYGFPIRPVVE